MSSSRAPRRSAEQWQALVEQWQQSGQSAKDFCREHGLGYASFCQWRKRLAGAEAASGAGERSQEPAFVDLASLASSGGGGWDIVLSLGDGLELRLSRR
jgi:transposase-like protein